MDTTQVRIKRSLNTDLASLANDSGFTKEQLLDMFLGDAVKQSTQKDAATPLPSVVMVRRKLGLPAADALEEVSAMLAKLKNLPGRLDAIEQRFDVLLTDESGKAGKPVGKRGAISANADRVRRAVDGIAELASANPATLELLEEHLRLARLGSTKKR